MQTETELFILELPILEDAAVDALHTFLLDLLTQFENHYFAQLHRYQQEQGAGLAASRSARGTTFLHESHPLDPPAELDDDFNDEIPF